MAYGLRYKIPFSSLDKKAYEIQISIKDYVGPVSELSGGDSPCVVSYTDNDYIYNPCRFAEALLSIVSTAYLTDLYANTPQDIKVNLYRQGGLVYTGYMVPEAYTQSNDGDLTAVEFSSMSALASLDYCLFSSDQKVHTILQLIAIALAASGGDYRYVYIPKTWTTDINSMSAYSISANNWIDEEGERMTYREILEEIAKFYTMTITEKDGNVYFVDVDYVSQGKSAYWRYTPDMLNETSVTLSNAVQMLSDANSHGVGNTLDVIPAYNAVNVLCSDYEVSDEALYPKMNNGMLTVYRTTGKTDKGYAYMKHYLQDPSKWTVQQYGLSGGTFVPIPFDLEPGTRAGAVLVDRTNFKETERPNALNWEGVFQIRLFDKDDMTVLMDAADDLAYPMIKMYQPAPVIAFDPTMYLCISGKVQYSDRNDGYVPAERVNKDDTIKDRSHLTDFYVPVQLRCGNRYFDGYNWVLSTSAYFKIYTDLRFDDQHFTYDALNFQNTNDYLYRLPALDGTLINFRNNAVVGDLEMTIYCPKSTTRRNYNHRYVFLSNIKISSQRQAVEKASNKQDTLYSSVIDSAYMNEMEDIELKVSSKNDSALSFSKVVDNGVSILDTVENFYTATPEKPENIIVQRNVAQYAKPKFKLKEITDTTYTPYQAIAMQSQPEKKFILCSESIDYKYRRSTATLIEIV